MVKIGKLIVENSTGASGEMFKIGVCHRLTTAGLRSRIDNLHA